MQVSLKVQCQVNIVHSDKLDWSSNRPDAFSVESSGHRLSIKQIKDGGGITITSNTSSTFINNISGRTVISGGRNVVIGNMSGSHIGEVWINGRRVDMNDQAGGVRQPKETPVLTVMIPVGTDVDIKTSGSSDIQGNGQVGHLSVSTSGSTDIDLSVWSADLKTSGSSDIRLRMTTSSPRISSKFSGSTNFEVVS